MGFTSQKYQKGQWDLFPLNIFKKYLHQILSVQVNNGVLHNAPITF